MAHIIDGKAIAASARLDIAQRGQAFYEKTGVRPGLAVVIVGEDPASKVYVRNKKKGCEEAGFYSEVHEMSAETTMDELLAKIEELKNNEKIHGILVQLPLPKHLDEKAVIDAIPPEKDVDAFHPVNTGKIMIGDYNFLPCTPAGVMKMLEYEKIDVSGKECVVIGRSNIVGKPMAMLMLRENATVTITHSRTKDLREVCKRADILIVAIGKPLMIDDSYVKEGAVVIDVGIHRDADNKICGDVDYDKVAPKCSAITPVPGGVGPMTIAMLMRNCLYSINEVSE